MASVSDYEKARLEIVSAFSAAMVEDSKRPDDGEAHRLSVGAFDLARRCGWHAEADEDFTLWCLKATQQEILAEGLIRALRGIRLGPLGVKTLTVAELRKRLDGLSGAVVFANCDRFGVGITGLRLSGKTVELVADGWTNDCKCEEPAGCPRCYEETGTGSPHGDLCQECIGDLGDNGDLYWRYRNDPRWPNGAADIERYIAEVPLTRNEAGFYDELLAAFRAAEGKS